MRKELTFTGTLPNHAHSDSVCVCSLSTDKEARRPMSRTLKLRHARGDTKVGADMIECSGSVENRLRRNSHGRKEI